MDAPLRLRFWFEAGIVSLCGLLTVVTFFMPDWIEAITGFDPDHGSGSLEWAVVAGLALAFAASGFAARREWHRWRTTAFVP